METLQTEVQGNKAVEYYKKKLEARKIEEQKKASNDKTMLIALWVFLFPIMLLIYLIGAFMGWTLDKADEDLARKYGK